LTQAVTTDTAKPIFEVLKKKGGGDGISQYSTLLSLGVGGEILKRRLHQKSKISAVCQS